MSRPLVAAEAVAIVLRLAVAYAMLRPPTPMAVLMGVLELPQLANAVGRWSGDRRA